MVLKRGGILFNFVVVLFLYTVCQAVDTEAIDSLREKVSENSASFMTADVAVIDEFLDMAIGEMLTAEDFWEAIDVRGVIVERKGDESMGRYRTEFIALAHKHLKSAFEEIHGPADEKERLQTARMLIILVALLGDVSLADYGIELLAHENSTVRYWAAKSIANSKITAQLKSSLDSSAMSDKIAGSLEALVEKEQYAEILNLVVEFAADLGGTTGKRLLLKVADSRIKSYADWTVEYELMDSMVLESLGQMIQRESSSEEKKGLARRFGQLYSYIIQRYIMGKDVLTEGRRGQLASVMVQVEQSALTKLLGLSTPRSNIKKWIERKNYIGLNSEYELLFGSSSKAGELASKLNFDYGKDSDGQPIKVPAKLKEAPNKASGATVDGD